MAVDKHQAVWCLTSQNGIGKSNLGQQATKYVGLLLWVGPPVTRDRQQLIGRDSSEFPDSVTYSHGIVSCSSQDFGVIPPELTPLLSNLSPAMEAAAEARRYLDTMDGLRSLVRQIVDQHLAMQRFLASSEIRSALQGLQLVSQRINDIRSTLSQSPAIDLLRQQALDFSRLSRIMAEELAQGLRPMIEFRASVAAEVSRMIEAQRQLRETAAQFHVLDSARSELAQIRYDELQTLADDVSARDEIFAGISEADILNAGLARLNREVLHSDEFSTATLARQINYLIDWTKKQDNDKLRAFALNIVCNILSNFIWLAGTALLTTVLTVGRGEPDKEVVRRVVSAIEEQGAQSNDVRVVRRFASVHASYRRKSKVVCTLQAGSIVQPIRKRGKWIEVVWMDTDSGEIRSGWVRRKMLKRLK